MTLCNSPYFVQCCIYVLKKFKLTHLHPSNILHSTVTGIQSYEYDTYVKTLTHCKDFMT